jgi:hypothetical protein
MGLENPQGASAAATHRAESPPGPPLEDGRPTLLLASEEQLQPYAGQPPDPARLPT